MSLGPVMLDIEGTALSPADRRLLREPALGGVILFARNYESPAQLAELTREIRALRSPELLIAVDQEGGRVQRFSDGLTRIPPMRELGRAYAQDPGAATALARETGWLLGAELAAHGVDFSFTPVLDLDWGVSEVIGDRAFHRQARVVAELGLALMRGLRDAGVVAVAKHFPGHGAVVADSHHELPVDRREFAELLEDLQPFARLGRDGLPAVMTAHVVYTACDELPATFSRWWLTDYLRGELGFDGAIISDDLTMQAARDYGSVEETARLALAAGCDMVLVCNRRDAAERAVAALNDWREPPAMVRLASLRGRRAEGYDALKATERWTNASRAVARLLERPELDLHA